jgi:hypothetical protein
MVHLNYNNLDDETQQWLLSMSKKDIEKRFGKHLRNYSKEHFVNYQALLEEEAIRNLYNYRYIFKIWRIKLNQISPFIMMGFFHVQQVENRIFKSLYNNIFLVITNPNYRVIWLSLNDQIHRNVT